MKRYVAQIAEGHSVEDLAISLSALGAVVYVTHERRRFVAFSSGEDVLRQVVAMPQVVFVAEDAQWSPDRNPQGPPERLHIGEISFNAVIPEGETQSGSGEGNSVLDEEIDSWLRRLEQDSEPNP